MKSDPDTVYLFSMVGSRSGSKSTESGSLVYVYFLAVSSAVSQNEQSAITLDHTAKSIVKGTVG
jgi:hypothetical protein